MRILIDECVPRPLKRKLHGHEFWHVHELGWAGTKNGALLAKLLEAGFQVLLTVDQNLSYQQNLTNSAVAVVVMAVQRNRLADLELLIPSVHEVLNTIRPGEVIVVES